MSRGGATIPCGGPLLRNESAKPLVEPCYPTLSFSFALLAGVHRMRGAEDVQGYVWVSVPIGVSIGFVSVDGGTNQLKSIS